MYVTVVTCIVRPLLFLIAVTAQFMLIICNFVITLIRNLDKYNVDKE